MRKHTRRKTWGADPRHALGTIDENGAPDAAKAAEIAADLLSCLRHLQAETPNAEHVFDILGASINVGLVCAEHIGSASTAAMQEAVERLMAAKARYVDSGQWALTADDVAAVEAALDVYAQVLLMVRPREMRAVAGVAAKRMLRQVAGA